MFELMLMRHAKSDWDNQLNDIDRPLSNRGSRDAFRMGEYLEKKHIIPDRMIVSSAQRTQETANHLLSSFNVTEKHIIVEPALYLAGRQTLCNVIEQHAKDNQRLLILAHNPGMDDLVSYLANTAVALSADGKLMVTCAVACYRLKGTSINCLCPLRDLKRVAARREPQQNGYSILKAHNAADACFRTRPTGLYDQSRLYVALFRQAINMASKTRLDSELVVKPEGTSN